MQPWRKRSLLCFWLLLAGTPLFSQYFFGQGQENEARKVIQSEDGSWIVVGKTRLTDQHDLDLAVWRLDACGNLMDEKRFGGTNQDEGLSVTASPDGGYLVAGYRFKDRDGFGRHDLYLLKFSAKHELEWERLHGRPWREIPFVVRPLPDGYVLAGYTKSQGLHGDVYLARLDLAGNLLWDQFYKSDFVDLAFDVQPLPHGFLVLATESGFYFPSQANHHHPDADIMLIVTDTLGQEIRRVQLGGPRHDFGRRLLPGPDQGWYVLGSTQNESHGSFDMYLLYLNADLKVVWEKRYGGMNWEYGEDMVGLENGNFVLLGSQGRNSGRSQGLVLNLDASGKLLSETSLTDLISHELTGLTLLPNGSLLVAGRSRDDLFSNAWVHHLNLQGLPIAPCPSPSISPNIQSAAPISYTSELFVPGTAGSGQPLFQNTDFSVSELPPGEYQYNVWLNQLWKLGGKYRVY